MSRPRGTSVPTGNVGSPPPENAPKHLLSTRQGLYVVESGAGGPIGASTCVSGPPTTGAGTTRYCEGPTGAVARINGGRITVVKAHLPSVVEEDNTEVAGAAGISIDDRGNPSVVYQDLLVAKNGSNPLPQPAGHLFGTLGLSSGVSVSVSSFAAAHPQSTSTLGGLPGETTYDSDPYDVATYRGGYVVTDDLLFVSSRGRISLLARFPTQAEKVPAGVLGPKPVTIDAQAVPTSVAVGPDGALYVGLLRGVPSEPQTAEIYRVVPGDAPTIWATGLTAVIAFAFAFAAQGRLLAAELSTGGLLAPPTVPGALVRVSANGRTVTTLPVAGLFHPTGLAVSRTGTVYVSNHGSNLASSATPGQVLQITGLG